MAGKAWFRPKKVGWGYTPQTWQGWLITLAPVLAIIVIVALAQRH
ncbi:MAG: hypothetical protein ABI345_09455 [Jatrophihabitans sp.]